MSQRTTTRGTAPVATRAELKSGHPASRGTITICGLAVAIATSSSAAFGQGAASKAQIQRGEYLANFGGCNDCHTPKTMTPKGPALDKSKLLSGYQAANPVPAAPAQGVLSPTGWVAATNGDLTAWIGPWGMTFAANLTPDKPTGMGGWTLDQFIKSMRTGKHLGVGRPILPPMPTEAVGGLNDADLKALYAYLQSIKPVANPVPPPVPSK